MGGDRVRATMINVARGHRERSMLSDHFGHVATSGEVTTIVDWVKRNVAPAPGRPFGAARQIAWQETTHWHAMC